MNNKGKKQQNPWWMFTFGWWRRSRQTCHYPRFFQSKFPYLVSKSFKKCSDNSIKPKKNILNLSNYLLILIMSFQEGWQTLDILVLLESPNIIKFEIKLFAWSHNCLANMVSLLELMMIVTKFYSSDLLSGNQI